ncbi:MAG: phosphotransferase [Bacteroidota bacterium]
MKQQALQQHFRRRGLPFEVVAEPIALEGGLLNHVWRVPTQAGSVIVKYAPPYIATQPEVALPCERAHFEAQALETLGQGLWENDLTIPTLYDYDNQANILVMQDAGPLPNLREKLMDLSFSDADAERIGVQLGSFIGHLHQHTFGQPSFAERFHNMEIQKVRKGVQYHMPLEVLTNWTHQASAVLAKMDQMGTAILQPGQCMIMGDLWPQSILIAPHEVWVIDWELTHYGFRVQDVGHLLAHLWMIWDRAKNQVVKAHIVALAWAFRQKYEEIAGQNLAYLQVEDSGSHPIAVHIGTEVLQRVIGNFSQAYVYQGTPDTAKKKIVDLMVELILQEHLPLLGPIWNGA